MFHTVGLYDRVTLTDADDGFTLDCDDAGLVGVDNLVLQAARAVAGEAGTSRGVSIRLEKSIPAGAGLGGGSSDAAAVIRGLNLLWGLEWDTPRMCRVAESVGSDVPFFIHGGAARVRGRGERVEPLVAQSGVWCVLLNPGVTMSTAKVFREFAKQKGDTRLTQNRGNSIITVARPAESSPDEARIARGGARVDDADDGVNDLEATACRIEPEVAGALAALVAAGGTAARMSGSGSTVFCVAADEDSAEDIRKRIEMAPHWMVWVVPLVGAETSRPGGF